jgi:hypothetical protein
VVVVIACTSAPSRRDAQSWNREDVEHVGVQRLAARLGRAL